MQNKLQELTDKLYNEGLSKGKQEGEAIVKEAASKADRILNDARAEAARIIAEAKKQAEELQAKVCGDIRLAAGQSIQSTRQEIENLLVSKVADAEITGALTSADFVKQVIMTVAKAFSPDNAEPADLSVILPEAMKKEMEPFLRKELAGILKGKVEASFSKKVTGGFTIGPKDGGWFVSFTDSTFKELISSYLRPATKKILFGE